MVFEPSAAPKDKAAFEAWYSEQVKWSEGHSYNDPSVTSPALQSWFDDMRKNYPPMNGPFAMSNEEWDKLDSESQAYVTDYSIGKFIIYAGFRWSVADEAEKSALRAADLHGVGLYDVSGNGRILFPKEQDVQDGESDIQENEHINKKIKTIFVVAGVAIIIGIIAYIVKDFL